MVIFFNDILSLFLFLFVSLLFQEKRDSVMKTAQSEGNLEGLSRMDLLAKRAEIPPVSTNDVPPPPESDDEEAKKDLVFCRRLYLQKARRVASTRRTKGRILLEAVERPGSSQLHVRNLLELAEANVPIPQPRAISSPPHDVVIPETPFSSPGSGGLF